MKFDRRFTEAGKSPYASLGTKTIDSEIRNPDGSIVFRAEGIEVPEAWSQVAADILAQKYFRKAGVPAKSEDRSRARCAKMALAAGSGHGGPEEACRRKNDMRARRSAWQVFDRLAGTWTYWGWKAGYFDAEADAHAFHDELVLHARQRRWCAPNSPQWFNTGLNWAYGIDGPAQGHFYVDYQTGRNRRRPTPPTSTRSPMPASFRASATIW